MKTIIVLVLLALATLPAVAKDKKQHTPVVSQDLQLSLWKAQAQVNGAQLALMQSRAEKALEAATAGYQSAMAQWRTTCGADYRPQAVGGDPACVPVPKPAKAPHVKK